MELTRTMRVIARRTRLVLVFIEFILSASPPAILVTEVPTSVTVTWEGSKKIKLK